MEYPSDFVEAVKISYPDWKELHDALDQGNSFVGRYLDDSVRRSISNEDIIAATSLSELQERAMKQQFRQRLYEWWAKLYMEQRTRS